MNFFCVKSKWDCDHFVIYICKKNGLCREKNRNKRDSEWEKW